MAKCLLLLVAMFFTACSSSQENVANTFECPCGEGMASCGAECQCGCQG